MAKGLLLLFFFTSSVCCFAQNIPVTGTVLDDKGTPLADAIVEIKEEGTTILTDTLGNFRISTRPRSTLIVNASGYIGDTLHVDGRTTLSVILKPRFQALEGVTVSVSEKSDPMHQMISESVAASLGGYSSALASGRTFSGSISAFSIKEETKGSRYLLTDTWAHGQITSMDGVVTNDRRMLINYDKMNRSLYITTDGRRIIEIDKAEVRSFDLQTDGQDYHFKRLRNIDSMQFFLVLREVPGKYSLYKLTKTRFIKSNYHSDGMVESGNPYDEYLDESFYFLQPPGDQPFKLITVLKMRVLKELLGADPKAASWLSRHKYDPVDEQFLKGMVDYMDQ